MESYLRIILLAIGAILISLITYDALLRRRKKSQQAMLTDLAHEIGDDPFHFNAVEPVIQDVPLADEYAKLKPATQKPAKIVKPEDILTLSVIARSGKYFESYELIQAITSTGMKYGDMNIFHYYLSIGLEKKIIFSLASATEPGDFDMDKLGEFQCAGLTLFTNLADVPDAVEAYSLMLKTAESLADDLDGTLYAAPKVPWDGECANRYHRRVLAYQSECVS